MSGEAAVAAGANAAAKAAAVAMSAGEAMRVEGVLMPSRLLSAAGRHGINGLRPAAERPEEVDAVDLVGLQRLYRARRVRRDAGPAPTGGRPGAHAGARCGRDDLHRRGRNCIDEARRAAL